MNRLLALLLGAFLSSAAVAQQVSQPAPATSVPNNAVLTSSSTPAFPNGVWRNTFAAGSRTTPLFYQPSAGACSLNSGNGDNGWQVKSGDGKCWLAQFGADGGDVRQWGAKCDGTTDDTAAWRAYVAWFNGTVSGVLQVPRGSICIVNLSAGPFVLNMGGTVQGYGIPGAGGGTLNNTTDLASSSVIRDISGSANPVFDVVTGKSISFQNLMLDAVPPKPANAWCVRLSGVTGTSAYTRSANFERVEFRGCNGIDIAYAVDLRVDRSIFLDYPGCAVRLHQGPGAAGENTFDFGDWRISDSLFFNLAVNSGTAFCHEVGAGGNFTNNTVNGGQYAYYMNWGGSHSEETRITGNILNQQAKASVAFFQAVPATSFSEVIIANNNFSTQILSAGAAANPRYGSIYVEKGIPPNFAERWMHLLNISNNTFNNCYDNSQGAVAVIHVRDGDNIMIANNQLIMNNNVGHGPCSNAMTAGISFIQTEGSSYEGDANRSGVLVCSVINNQISFAYQFYVGVSAYMPLYNSMAPLCVIQDAQYHTFAQDPHLGYNRVIEKQVILGSSIADWTTIATLTPNTTTGLTVSGEVRAVLSGHTSLTAFGVNDAAWWFMYTAGVPTVGTIRAAVTHDSIGGGGFPQFRLNPAGGVIQLQAASSNGVAVLDAGQMKFSIDLAAPQNVATTFYWKLEPANP